MNLLPVLAVVASVVVGCTASAPTATQPLPTSSPIDTAAPPPTAVVASPAGVASPFPGPGSTPAVTHGEAWIAFQWVDGSGDGIFLVRPDGTGHHQLLPDMAGSEIHPDWSPDGGRIAFVRQTPVGPDGLWVVDADGTDAERLYECEVPCNQVDFPDWSPDGSSIYFSQDGDVPQGGGIPQTFSIGRFDLASGAANTVISRDDGMTVWQPRVSPDGSTLAYLAGSEELGTAIFISPIIGGPATQLTEYEMLGAHPDWTPDGRIVFHTYDLAIFPSLNEPANLFIMDADGGNLEQLTQFEESGFRAAQPRVAPDGEGVAFTQVEGPGTGTRRMAFLPFGESEPRWLTPEPINGTHPQLRPSP